MNEVPASERVHISFFGKRNVGKSSLLNAITGQALAVVSEIKGTTTDPVYKTMEIPPFGPVMLIDTPGIDDTGALGQLRVEKSYQVLNKTDLAVLVQDIRDSLSKEETDLISVFEKKQIPYLIVYNKVDLVNAQPDDNNKHIYVSAETGAGVKQLIEKVVGLISQKKADKRIVGDLVKPGDFVILVVSIDGSAPKGRLILPQQQTIRDLLDANAVSIVTTEKELSKTLLNLGRKPKLIITDSQVFATVSAATPEDILLTSFSILFARYKGDLEQAVQGAAALENLNDGDKILIAEGCTHHRQCDDIGTVKIPTWIRQYTGKEPSFHFCSGTEFPEDLSSYHLVVHCGGCMLNTRAMKYRLLCAQNQRILMTNYGILIAYMQGVLERSLRLFPDIADRLK